MRQTSPLQNNIRKSNMKYKKTLISEQIKFSKNHQNLKFSLPHCLTTFTSLECKQSSIWPSFYTTITNSPVVCAFWGSDECRPSVPCLFFFLHSSCLSSSSTKPYRDVNFLHQHLLSAAYVTGFDKTRLPHTSKLMALKVHNSM